MSILSASYHLNPPNDTSKDFEIGDTVSFSLLETASDTAVYKSIGNSCITYPSVMIGIMTSGSEPKTVDGNDDVEYRYEINQIADITFTYSGSTTQLGVSIYVDQSLVNVLNYLKKNMDTDSGDELHMWINDITGIQKSNIEYEINVGENVKLYDADGNDDNYYQELIVGVSGKSDKSIDEDVPITAVSLCGTYTQRYSELVLDNGTEQNMMWGSVSRSSAVQSRFMPIIGVIPDETYWRLTFADKNSSHYYGVLATYIYDNKPGQSYIDDGILVTDSIINKTWVSHKTRTSGPQYCSVFQPAYTGSGDDSSSTIKKVPTTGLWVNNSGTEYEPNYIIVSVNTGDKDNDALSGIYIRDSPGGGSFTQCVGDGSDGINPATLEYNSSGKNWELKSSDDVVLLTAAVIGGDEPTNQTEPLRYGWYDGTDKKTGFGVVVCSSMLPFNITEKEEEEEISL